MKVAKRFSSHRKVACWYCNVHQCRSIGQLVHSTFHICKLMKLIPIDRWFQFQHVFFFNKGLVNLIKIVYEIVKCDSMNHFKVHFDKISDSGNTYMWLMFAWYQTLYHQSTFLYTFEWMFFHYTDSLLQNAIVDSIIACSSRDWLRFYLLWTCSAFFEGVSSILSWHFVGHEIYFVLQGYCYGYTMNLFNDSTSR